MQQQVTTNLLRETQVRECREELSRLDGMLNAPPHIRSRVDVQEAHRRRGRLRRELEAQTPQPYDAREKDAAVRRFHQLGEEIKVGMPSSEVMRRNPPGAVQQHQAWERRNKKKVLERKHIGLRLHATGDLDPVLGEAAINIELLRDHSTGRDLAMDGAQIPKTSDFHFGAPRPESVVLSDEQISTLQEVDPELAGQLALMDSETRGKVKAILQKFIAESAEPATPEKPKRVLHPAMQRMTNLRSLCKANGINSHKMKADDMAAALRAKGIEVE